VLAGTSPLAELMACLHVLAEPGHHPDARVWVERCYRVVPETLRSELFRFAPLWARYRARVFFPVGAPLNRSLQDELTALHGMSDELFLPFLADAITGRRVGPEGRLMQTDSSAWVRECERRSFARGDLAYSLVHQPQRFRDDLVSLLNDCSDVFFADEWQRTEPVLEASARQVTSRLARESTPEVVESLSEMASRRGSDTTVYFDKLQHLDGAVDAHGLLLVPSLRARPHVILKLDDGVPKVMHYLARTPQRDESASQELLRRRLLVLSEPARWELCRHLIGESITTTELSMRMEVTKYAVSRHLRVLREAGLISSHKEGRQVFHRLNASVILRLGPEVLEGILR
jgi:DNA-binding transcriptional ArsR family regulator